MHIAPDSDDLASRPSVHWLYENLTFILMHRLILTVLSVGALFCFTAYLSYSPFGLDDPVPIGPYLNGAFPTTPSEETPVPTLLSETGAFSNLETLDPADGLIPYALNTPFWSDGALKSRWVAIPNDGSFNTSDEQVLFSQEDVWQFPPGTVVVKHFDLATDLTDLSQLRRLETRFIIKGEGTSYYFLTYRWNEEGTDAVLLEDGLVESIAIRTSNGVRIQPWTYPSADQCIDCHRSVSGFILGPSTRQLNGNLTYPSTGRTANQLATWNRLGIFSDTIPEDSLSAYLTSRSSDDQSASLQDRALSYLDSNCAYCHRPGSIRTSSFDARLSKPLETSGIINGFAFNNLSIQGAAIVVPGDTARSLIYQRMRNLNNQNAMPPLAKAVIDSAGLKLIESWILSLDDNPTDVERLKYVISENEIDVYPNPFRNRAFIRYTLNAPSPVKITLFVAQGREITTLFDGFKTAGQYEETISDTRADGVYYIQLQVGSQTFYQSLVKVQ